MKFKVLNAQAFSAEYRKAFEMQDVATEAEKERFREEVFTVQGAVVDALKAKWRESDDFEVGWDFNYCYHSCGGIYSDRIFGLAYVETIGEALKSVDPAGRWTYHTACEIVVKHQANTAGEATEDRGEFFVRGDTCYINGSTMKREWRARLGCAE